jgi:adenosylcobinamide-phosphate synthase
VTATAPSLAVPGATLAVGLALVLDALFAEPPERVHPVALLGRLVGPLDREWRRPGLFGAAIAVGVPVLAAGVAWAAVAGAGRLAPLAAAVLAGLVLFSTTSLRMLLSTASDVIELTGSAPASAREAVRALVGRDAAELSPAQLRSAAVESAAENLADGLVAPLLAFALGVQLSVAAGAAAAAWVKAVNTLDSMLGYPDKPHGRASARLDDAVMWLPARASALLLAAAAADPGALGRARRWARTPPSPNSGWPMATLAAVLGARLAKPGAYDLNPEGPLPDVRVARRGVRAVGLAGALAFLLAGLAGLGPLLTGFGPGAGTVALVPAAVGVVAAC